MSDELTRLAERFDGWIAEHDDLANPATPAATVLVVRDSTGEPSAGPEVLMVQRNDKGTFASNWVFPGGKVDPEDHDASGDVVLASRRAAAREAEEEVDVMIDPESLVPFSHWMPPATLSRRFATWFYATEVPPGTAGDVSIDGGEIVDHLWVTPAEALAKHAAGEVELMPPTWVTLRHLDGFATTAEMLAAIAARDPKFYVTKRISMDPPTVAWHGDAGYAHDDPAAPGPRHRLTMDPAGWRFEEPE